jgi:hypothetical protein
VFVEIQSYFFEPTDFFFSLWLSLVELISPFQVEIEHRALRKSFEVLFASSQCYADELDRHSQMPPRDQKSTV